MKIILVIISLFLITSCSVQSSQYNMIKNLLTDEDNTFLPKKNWSLFIEDRVIDLYAINYEDQIIFADEKINLFYKFY